MKETQTITGPTIWNWIKDPEKGDFILISNGPYQDNSREEGRCKNKKDLVRRGKKMRSHMYSSLRIYNDQKRIVWDAFLPTTISPRQDEYDPEYFKTVRKE